MTVALARPTILTSHSTGYSASVRLQCFETNSPSDPVRSLEISPFQKNPLHYYDQDVVRELSLPPDSVSPSATTRPQFPRSNGFPTPHSQPEAPLSSYLTSPHHVPLETFNPRPRTPSVPETHPSLFAHHGLPSTLPPPPRTTFYSNTQIPPEPVPEADNLVSYFDSLLRGSYSQMLSKQPETTLPSNSAQRLPQGGESIRPASPCTAPTDTYPSPPRLRCSPLPLLAEPELSLNDMLRADYLEGNNFEEFLTSPLLQDDSPEETPFLETPGEDAWTSPMVDAGDDSFGFSEMPLFGAVVRRQEESTDVKTPESLDIFGLLHLCPPAEPTEPDSSKMDSVTPALDPLDSLRMYTLPPTPALPPASLYSSPRRPSTLSLAPSPSSSSTINPATAATSKQARPSKPLPTGTRRNITPSGLVPIDAPTQPRQYVTPSATSRRIVPAAFTKGKKRARSEVDGGGDDADQLPEDLDPNTQEAIEIKRRQNTLAARRSRQRKLEHVRELEETVERITQDRDMWMARAYDAEAKLRAHGLSS